MFVILWRFNFENYLSFITKAFSYMIKKSEEKFEYLKNSKSILGEIKSIFDHF